MKNGIRRNRNIGTSKQGHGKDNELIIPATAPYQNFFYEKLGKYEKLYRSINGYSFTFVVEETREGAVHSCSVEDITKIISKLPTGDYGELRLIVLRQPKRKEEVLSPVWGRLIYDYDFEGEYYPAIIIEAIEKDRLFKWSKKLLVDDQKEMKRLREDGHNIIEGKRHFTAEFNIKNVRSTQLYRTLLHEFGHYVHYKNFIKQNDENPDRDIEQRKDLYFSLSKTDREKYANRYADNMRAQLISNEVIPFDPIDDQY